MQGETSGLTSLDDFLGGGLLLGDNVVWLGEDRASSTGFVEAFLAAPAPGRRRYVALASVDAVGPLPEGVELLDLTATTGVEDPEEVEALLIGADPAEGDRVVIDGLDEIVARWGAPEAARFYQRVCPRLFGVGAIAYWTATRGRLAPVVLDTVTRIAQCVFDVAPERLRVVKAEGRPAKLQGALVDLERSDGELRVTREHAVGRVGEGLRRLRRDRNLNQRQLAELAGVTPAAISQTESGRRGLSLDTLVPLCERLGIGLDDLLGSRGTPDHVVARRDRSRVEGSVTALFDDPAPGPRAYLVRLGVDEQGSPPFAHKGVELVLVAEGLVLVDLGDSTPVLRAGDSVMVSRVPIRGWTNLGEGEARLFWVVD
jgi:transcriptional regulator with XRE-family HTH domain